MGGRNEPALTGDHHYEERPYDPKVIWLPAKSIPRSAKEQPLNYEFGSHSCSETSSSPDRSIEISNSRNRSRESDGISQGAPAPAEPVTFLSIGQR